MANYIQFKAQRCQKHALHQNKLEVSKSVGERVQQSEWVDEWEGKINNMSKRKKRVRVCASKGLVIEWSSDPVIKGSSDQVIKQWSDQMIKCLISGVSDWLIHWLIDWLIDWLIK